MKPRYGNILENILHYILCQFEWYFHNKPVRKIKKTSLPTGLLSFEKTLNIQIAYAPGMGLNKTFARINGITHQHVKGPICFGCIFYGYQK